MDQMRQGVPAATRARSRFALARWKEPQRQRLFAELTMNPKTPGEEQVRPRALTPVLRMAPPEAEA